MLKTSESNLNCRLVIQPQLVFSFSVVAVEGTRMYSGMVRAVRDVNARRLRHLLPLTIFGWLRLFGFHGDGCHFSDATGKCRSERGSLLGVNKSHL